MVPWLERVNPLFLVLLALTSGALGNWSWDLRGAVFTPPPGGKESSLFSTPEGIPPTLWNLPGPGDSLIQYDGELGILRLLFPSKEAYLELPEVKSQPNALVLWDGKLWIAENRGFKVIFPPDSPGGLPPLPLPITALRTQNEQLFAQVLTGVWYVFSPGEWKKIELSPEISGIPALGSHPLPASDKPENLSDHLAEMENLMAQDRWQEANLIGQRALSHPTFFSQELWGELEDKLMKLHGVILGYGKLDAQWTPTGLQISYHPDSRDQAQYLAYLRFQTETGEELYSLPLLGAQKTNWNFPEGGADTDYLWVDLRVTRSDKPEEITILRLPSMKGLSFWLKSD